MTYPFIPIGLTAIFKISANQYSQRYQFAIKGMSQAWIWQIVA